MTLTFAYSPFPRPPAVAALTGLVDRPRPIIAVTVLGPLRSMPVDSLLDTGADDTIFHEHVAAQLGIDLSTAVLGTGRGVSGQRLPVRYVTVRLRIADNQERREWPAVVGFAALTNRYSLLGYTGVLQYFTTVLHGDRRQVDLTVNPTYPGT